MREFYAGSYDVAVIGAGHAGIEASLACARLGMKTVCFTINLDAVGNMPCNPAIGGTGKGHLVRELDALGGEMAKAADLHGATMSASPRGSLTIRLFDGRSLSGVGRGSGRIHLWRWRRWLRISLRTMLISVR